MLEMNETLADANWWFLKGDQLEVDKCYYIIKEEKHEPKFNRKSSWELKLITDILNVSGRTS